MIIKFIDNDFIFINRLYTLFADRRNGKCLNEMRFISRSIDTIQPTKGTGIVCLTKSTCKIDMKMGGIYKKWFGNCEEAIKNKLKVAGFNSSLGFNYLPVGCSIVVRECGMYLIIVPKMYFTTDISSTKNAYHVFLSILMIVHKNYGIRELVCPAICCGFGGIDSRVAAEQVFQAYCDFLSGKIPVDYEPDRSDMCIIFKKNEVDDYERLQNNLMKVKMKV